MTSHYVVAERFFHEADALRSAFETHFSNPMSHAAPQQVWNYWYVPGAYTYLKTDPSKLMPRELVARFMQQVNHWALNTLGLTTQLNPWLSLYVNGCGQTIHNDAAAGQMGFVYSITKWDTRNFLGGETILFHPSNYWQTDRIKRSGAGTSFYDLIPSRYNQMVVFDDRVIHGVQTLQGTMNPLEGRVVLHGHLKAEAVALSGPIAAEAAIQAVRPTIERINSLTQTMLGQVNGFVTVRLTIGGDGRVKQIQPLCDRLLPLTPDELPVQRYRKSIGEWLMATTFPAAEGDSQLTLPIVAVG